MSSAPQETPREPLQNESTGGNFVDSAILLSRYSSAFFSLVLVFCFLFFVLYCIVLCCFVLFCFVLFCFVLFCFVLFCFVLFCFVLFCFVLFCFVLFCFVLFCFVLFFVYFYIFFVLILGLLDWRRVRMEDGKLHLKPTAPPRSCTSNYLPISFSFLFFSYWLSFYR